MTNPLTIPTNFRVPKDCRHEWLLFHKNELFSRIQGVPGENKILHFGNDLDNCDNKALILSRCNDWSREVVEHLRSLCK